MKKGEGNAMKNNIEWLKDRILAAQETYVAERDSFEPHSGGRRYYNGTLSSISLILGLINQLDEPEVLSQEWLDKNVVHVRGLGDIVEAEAVANIIVPNQELPVIPNFVADFIEVRKGTDAHSLKYILCVAVERGEQEECTKAYDWISANDEMFARAWLDEYEVEEEPLYHALIKGHELVNDYDIYWNCDKFDNDVFVSRLHPLHDNFSTELSKSEWNELGINDSNADFIRVEDE